VAHVTWKKKRSQSGEKYSGWEKSFRKMTNHQEKKGDKRGEEGETLGQGELAVKEPGRRESTPKPNQKNPKKAKKKQKQNPPKKKNPSKKKDPHKTRKKPPTTPPRRHNPGEKRPRQH